MPQAHHQNVRATAAAEDVVGTNGVGLSVSGNSLTKTGTGSMKDTGALMLPFGPPRSTRAWGALLLFAGATFGLAVAPPRPALGAAAGSCRDDGTPTAGAVASNQKYASQPKRGEGRLWYPVAEDELGYPDPTRRIEGKYLTLRLDRRKLADLLARAPRERPAESGKSEVVIELPWPDGSFRSFRIEEASIVEPGLKVRCPDLKTYRGRGRDDRSAYVRFNWSPSGFYAGVSSAEGTVSIVPYSRGDTRNYIVYYGRDWRPGPEQTERDAAAGRAAAGPPPAASASPAQPAAASIEEITIERRCFGCENQYTLTLRRDGTAILMRAGFLSGGASDHTCTGSVAPQAFARLANMLQREGFFDLNEVYLNPQLADGASAKTTVVVNGRPKTVGHRDEVGPPNLKAIEQAIDALGEKISWTGRP